MQITIGATCWDGVRSKSLTEPKVQEFKPIESVKRVARFSSGIVIPFLLATPLLSPIKAFAAAPEAIPVISSGIKSKILHAFDPLIDLIMSLSFPIAGVMIAGGCLFIMVGNRERGMQMLQNAALGYILVQLTPMMLNLLVGIGGSV